MDIGLQLGLVMLLIFFNGYFVAAEFAIVAMRTTRIDELIKEGNKKAIIVKKVKEKHDLTLAAAQLGITLTSLGIGAVAEPSIAKLIEKLIHLMNISMSVSLLEGISFFIGFGIATVLHITLGEQFPKMYAIEKAEKLSLITAPPLYYFTKITFPLIKVLQVLTSLLLKTVGIDGSDHESKHSGDEILMIISNSELDDSEKEMAKKIVGFQEIITREVMVHRKDMEVIYLSDPVDDTMKYIKDSAHSRIPVCGEDKDDIRGYITVKDVYNYLEEHDNLNIESIMRTHVEVFETTPIIKSMRKLQKAKNQMAIVLDEYGGVSGLVTIEDIVEEIVGDIQDEFDEEIESFVESDKGVIVDATLRLDEIQSHFSIYIEDVDGIDTLGGYVLSKIDCDPEIGQSIIVSNYKIEIVDTDGYRIKQLEFTEIELVEEYSKEVEN